jgi:hypothetical protein
MCTGKKLHPVLRLSLFLLAVGCIPQTERLEPATQPGSTPTAFIGIPKISNPLIQAEGESIEGFIVRIAVRDISYHQPVLVALTKVKDKNSLWFGVSAEMRDVQKCWRYEKDSTTECSVDELNKVFISHTSPVIFFAFAFSNNAETLIILDHYHDWDEEDYLDGYRLVIEEVGDKWIEKSILPWY